MVRYDVFSCRSEQHEFEVKALNELSLVTVPAEVELAKAFATG
jgi:hypothetical protein